jgi:hypothetical protein
MRRFLPLVVLFACGSDPAPASSTPGSDGGTNTDASGPSGPTVACPSGVAQGPACSQDGACCSAVVASESPAEGFRCTGGTWKSDNTCLPPPPACTSPLTGSIVRVDGTSIPVKCLEPIGRNKVIGAVLDLNGGKLEIEFDAAPKDGDVVQLRPFNGTSEAGTAAGFQIGTPGGFAGFTANAESVSGTITVTKVVVDGAGNLTTFAATLDAQVQAKDGPAAQWTGKLTGSWQ